MLTMDHAVSNVKIGDGVADPAAKYSVFNSIPSVALHASCSGIELSRLKLITSHVIPDTAHLAQMKDALLAGQLSLPIFNISLSRTDQLSVLNSFDCSYSGSKIVKTYWTLLNESQGNLIGTDTAVGWNPYELKLDDGNFLEDQTGIRTFVPIQRCMIDYQGQKIPSSDALTECDANQMKSYVEKYDHLSLGEVADYYTRKFYSLFDYTSGSDLFSIPEIQVEQGL